MAIQLYLALSLVDSHFVLAVAVALSVASEVLVAQPSVLMIVVSEPVNFLI